MERLLVALALAILISAPGRTQETRAPEADAATPPETRAAATPASEPTEADPAGSSGGVKTLLGMSILGNEEAPKSLVIVPWKSSEIGDGIGVANLIDGRARPVDKEVFLREVRYYQLRSGAAE